MNIFQGEGVFLMCFVCVLVYNSIFSWGGHKSRQADRVSHKTWLQKVHGGWDLGGVTWK